MADFPPDGYRLELLTSHHPRKKFASGDARADEWLIHKALSAMKKNTSTTRVLIGDGGIAGYYTLATTALDVSLVPDALFLGIHPLALRLF